MSDLNRMTGYALTGLATGADGQLTDPRLNTSSPLLAGAARLDDFLGHLEGTDRVLHRGSDLADDEPARAVVHDPHAGIPGVLVIRPVWCTQWHRVGDALDAAGEQGRREARLRILTEGIWPYNAQFMDAATGEVFGDQVLAWVRARADRSDPTSPVASLTDHEWDELAAASTGLASAASADARVVPAVPSAVVALVNWGRLFNDETLIRQLRPALYTWWS